MTYIQSTEKKIIPNIIIIIIMANAELVATSALATRSDTAFHVLLHGCRDGDAM